MMKYRNRITAIGLLSLVLCGSAAAHEAGGHPAYPGGNWAGSAAVWGPPQGGVVWAGTLGYGASHGYTPGFVAWAVPSPSRHFHGSSCRHPGPHAWGHSHRRGKQHGHKHGHEWPRNGYEREHGHRH